MSAMLYSRLLIGIIGSCSWFNCVVDYYISFVRRMYILICMGESFDFSKAGGLVVVEVSGFAESA